MTDNTRRVLAWLPLTGVAALVIRTALVWNQLPAVMMSHFNIHGQPDGWMPRTALMVVSFATVALVVLLFAAISDRISRRKPVAGIAVLAFAYVVDAFIITLFWNVITSNLERVPLRVLPIWIFIVVLVPAVLALSIDWRWWFSSERIEAVRKIKDARLITEQHHGSTAFAYVFVLAGLVFAVFAFITPSHNRPAFVLPLMLAIAVVILISAAWAWQGFTYRFTTQGVEIRALGFRLRSIPLSEIRDFRSERCNPLTDFGGWGVKGFGTDTAYIWGGHKVLHIRTNRGDVYLGHQDPDRLVRDLDAIMHPAH